MDAPISQGRVILGKYRVERVIGKGAMGVVLAARHIQLDDRVAIKLLLPEMLAEPGIQERFLQEARAARRIKSEHVTRVTDVGILETGTPYIIMEYLEGKDLAKIRGERGTLEIEEVVEYVLQACDAIAEAHSHGIIHRDLKPANLFLTRRPDGSPLVKVLDFGTSKMAPKEADPNGGIEMTQTGMAIGSPSYMAPEQMLSSRNLDARADVWALGVILYNLLTGTFPFKADTLLQMCAAVIQSPPTPPSKHRDDLPLGLEAAIVRCLQKKPEERFSDVAALARALLPFASAQAHFLVERIERVLGVSSDLATFLAPSVRKPPIQQPVGAPGADIERIDVDVPVSLIPPRFTTRPEGRPEAAIITTSLTTTALASVVRSDRSDVEPSSSGKEAKLSAGRSKKTILVGAGAALSIGLGLAFLLSSPVGSASTSSHGTPDTPPGEVALTEPPALAVRPVETATPIRTPSPAARQEAEAASTAAATAATATPSPSAAPSDEPKAAAGTESPSSGAPLAKATPGGGAAAPGRTRGSTPPASASPATSPQASVHAPSPVKSSESPVVIPDDR